MELNFEFRSINGYNIMDNCHYGYGLRSAFGTTFSHDKTETHKTMTNLNCFFFLSLFETHCVGNLKDSLIAVYYYDGFCQGIFAQFLSQSFFLLVCFPFSFSFCHLHGNWVNFKTATSSHSHLHLNI